MTIDKFVSILESVSRIALAAAIAFVALMVFAQPAECPACGNPIDRPQTYTRAQVIGEIHD